MFERSTEDARAVVVNTQEEARSLHSPTIGTQHILLALIKIGGESVATKALTSLDVTFEKVKNIVYTEEGAGTPDGHVPFTPRAKKVLEFSVREALLLGHNYVGTEHILLGLVREGEGMGANALVSLGASLGQVRLHVIQILSGRSFPEKGNAEVDDGVLPDNISDLTSVEQDILRGVLDLLNAEIAQSAELVTLGRSLITRAEEAKVRYEKFRDLTRIILAKRTQ